MTPLVTVLLPVYNGALHLNEAIESILNQTFTDFELLIINDGSIDNSESIICSYNDQRITYLLNDTNKGLIYTLNKGIGLAKGKYIARMDADDISLPERIIKQVAAFKTYSDLAVCGTAYETFGGENSKKHLLPLSFESINTELLFSCCIGHPTVMMRKSFLIEQNLAYQESYLHAEDYKLWLDISTKGQIINLPEVLLMYREHSGQVSNLFVSIQNSNRNRIILEKLKLHVAELKNEEEEMFLNLVLVRPLSEIKVIKKLIFKILSSSKNLPVEYLEIRLFQMYDIYKAHRVYSVYFNSLTYDAILLKKFHLEFGALNTFMLSKGYIKFLLKSIF